VDIIELQGKHILETLEFSVSDTYGRYRGNGRHKRDVEAREFNGQAFLQMSGKSHKASNIIKQKTYTLKSMKNKVQVRVFWVMTPCSLVCGCQDSMITCRVSFEVEQSVLLACYAASLGNQFSVFPRNLVPSYQGSGCVDPVRQHHIPEEQNSEEHTA
jgi:hypothetical protein